MPAHGFGETDGDVGVEDAVGESAPRGRLNVVVVVQEMMPRKGEQGEVEDEHGHGDKARIGLSGRGRGHGNASQGCVAEHDVWVCGGLVV